MPGLHLVPREEDGGMQFPSFGRRVFAHWGELDPPRRQHCWGFELHFKAGAGGGFCKPRETGKYLSESINPPPHPMAGGVSAGTEGSLVDLLNHFRRRADTKHCGERPPLSTAHELLQTPHPFHHWGRQRGKSFSCLGRRPVLLPALLL